MQSDDMNQAVCGVMEGTLPGKCAQMVFPYVPMQENASQVYTRSEGLASGTLFPGLNLPFHKEAKARAGDDGTPLWELMAVDFAISELGLYLDTHPSDQEAFALYQKYVQMYQEGKKRYQEQYGPLMQKDTAQMGKYRWLENPWPWDAEGGKK